MKVRAFSKADGKTIAGYRFDCPGCKCWHMVYTNHDNAKANWTFNEDLKKPTFSPSVLVNADLKSPGFPRCHSFVRDGKIQFLSDCTHDLAGQTVDLPEIDEA